MLDSGDGHNASFLKLISHKSNGIKVNVTNAWDILKLLVNSALLFISHKVYTVYVKYFGVYSFCIASSSYTLSSSLNTI